MRPLHMVVQDCDAPYHCRRREFVVMASAWRDTMTPDTAFSWTLIGSLAIALMFGALSFGGSVWKFLFRTVSSGVYPFAIFGIVLITSPKWTELAIEIAGLKLQINQLKAENETLSKNYAAVEAQRVKLQTEVASLRSEVEAASKLGAREWVNRGNDRGRESSRKTAEAAQRNTERIFAGTVATRLPRERPVGAHGKFPERGDRSYEKSERYLPRPKRRGFRPLLQRPSRINWA